MSSDHVRLRVQGQDQRFPSHLPITTQENTRAGNVQRKTQRKIRNVEMTTKT